MVTPPPTDALRPDLTAPDVTASEAALPEVVGLERLHPEQREAVTHGEGPLLVVAGAGTGKTQVVTHRIAWLISEKRARPEQILALTFTDKAAAEMESRVDLLVPYGLVGATLATFNAFCDRLVREHAVELGLTSRLRVEAQAEILVFLRERLFELGLERYLPLGQPDAHLQALTGLFDRARNEDVSPERYLEFARALAAGAGDDPERRDRAAAELEKARAYGKYEALLMKAGRVDFSSQIRLALKLLRERAHVRREVQERWRWILVDEFQDTNHVQFELVRLLAGERRNLTVVGDDDQSIYRFRGARIENLLEFLDVYPDAKQVILRRNHRSGQRILNDAHRLIRANDPWRLESQRGWDKRLLAQRIDPATGDVLAGTVQHRTFASGRDEAEWVAEEIGGAVAAGTARPGDFAVLARAHGHLDPFALALKSRGVRFRRVGMRGLYARPEVLLCLNALRSVADPDGGVAHQVLGDPLFGADPVDLARIGQRAKRTNRGFLRLALDAVNGPARDGAGCAEISRVAVRRFATLHAALCDSAIRRPTSEVLYQFVTESGLLAALTAEESAESLERVQNLNKLFGIVSRVGPLLKQDRVPAFIEHLDLLIEMGDDPAAAELETDEDAVSLLTAHGAKGLEFPVVYLVNLVEQRFPQFRRAEEMEFPPELKAGAHASAPPPDPASEHYREERRLCYVGMTRARDRLVLTHAQDYGGKRSTNARAPEGRPRHVGARVHRPLRARGRARAGAARPSSRRPTAHALARADRRLAHLPAQVPVRARRARAARGRPLVHVRERHPPRHQDLAPAPDQGTPGGGRGRRGRVRLGVVLRGILDARARGAHAGAGPRGVAPVRGARRGSARDAARGRDRLQVQGRRRRGDRALGPDRRARGGHRARGLQELRGGRRREGGVAREGLVEGRPARALRARLLRGPAGDARGGRAAVRGDRYRGRGGGEGRAPGARPRARARGRRRDPRGALPAQARPAKLRLLLVPALLRPQRGEAGMSAGETGAHGGKAKDVNTTDARALLDAACEFARASGAILLEGYGRVHAPERKGRIDLVTEYDRRSEALLLEHIRKRFPEHAILAEESGAPAGAPASTAGPTADRGSAAASRDGVRWLCDPLDGTTNFAHNYPFFCVSVGVEVAGEMAAGAVYDPVRDELFAAATGAGATRNGAPIHVSALEKVEDALLVTGFPYDVREHPERHLPLFQEFLLRAQGVRRDGSAALNLCYVAMGRFDGMWEGNLNPWDIAAGSLIVREAGGTITGYAGEPLRLDGRRIVAGNPGLHARMLEVVALHPEAGVVVG